VALYARQVGEESAEAHMKAFAFVEGEQITYLRGERGWIAVSGIKGGHIFYRRAALACRGQSWHHVAFEYPLEAKPEMDRVVTRLSRSLDYFENEGCQSSDSAQ
jgi:hypothetical protein